MAPPSPSEGTVADTSAEPSPSSTAAYPGTPRWVKVLGVVALVVVLLFLGVHLAGGGMGPGAHLSHLSHVSGR